MEIKINKEIREYSESIFLGLSLRQIVFSLLAMLAAAGLFFTVRDAVGQMEIAWICTLGAAPFAAMGFVKYQGMTAERFVLAFIRAELLMPKHLVFEGENIYQWIKSLIDRCTANVYREYLANNYTGDPPTLREFHAELLRQDEPEARDVALAIELFTNGSLNTFARQTNVDTDSRIVCYDIRDLGKQLLPIGMLVVLDNIFNRIVANKEKGRRTWIFIDECYLLFQHEYSSNFLFTLWKRVRKYGACCTGLTQNVDDLLQSHTARTMLANSEFLVMLNQAATDRIELAKLLNISENQLSYITNVPSGHGLLKCGGSIVPFSDNFPTGTKMYRLMSTKFSEE